MEERAERLEWAVHDDQTVTVRNLLAAGAAANAVDEDGRPLVALAVSRCSEGALRVLVEHGASLDVATSDGLPLLHGVVLGRDLPAMLPLLLELGADVHLSDSHGWTALHVAAAHGYAGSAQLLLNAGADPAARTSTGLLPADIAKTNGHFELAGLLSLP